MRIKKIYIYAIIFLLGACDDSREINHIIDHGTQDLIIFETVDGHGGVLNDNGDVIITKYRFYSGANDGLIASVPYEKLDDFHYGHNIGFVDSKGAQKIPFIYEYDETPPRFSEGLCAIKHGKYSGYIDGNNNIIIPFIFNRASSFHEGYAVVEKDNKLFTINKKGTVLFELKYGLELHFGLLSEKFEYDVPKFREGLMRVRRDDGLYGFINTTGAISIDFKYKMASDFNEGYAVVDGGVIDRNGMLTKIDDKVMTFPWNPGFHEGLALVRNSQGLNGYINTCGEVVIPCIYSSAENFSFGLAAVEYGGEYFFIDQKNIKKTKAFKFCKAFSKNGLAQVLLDDHTTGYIDRYGAFKIAPFPVAKP